eukprot:501983-Prymnesium_polylepis.1
MAELTAVSLPCGLATALSSRTRSHLAVTALGAMGPPRVFGRQRLDLVSSTALRHTATTY